MLWMHQAYWHMPVQNGMGAPALDYHVCHRGQYAGVETKAPGKRPTARQLATMRGIHRSGGTVVLIDGRNLSELGDWLAAPAAGLLIGITREELYGDESK